MKEHQIAMEVFARSADFDPRFDATVRVHTSRLRAKLAEYYAVEGVDDPLILELPKGSYALRAHRRAAPDPPLHARTTALSELPSRAEPRETAMLAMLALGAVCVLSVSALLYSGFNSAARAAVPHAAPVSPAMRLFWRRFVDPPQPPLVVFSNAEFVGRPETGMRYYNPAIDSRDEILDHYTGVGEVLAMHELDRVFAEFQHAVQVKRGRLLSLDDVKNNNLIFVGSPSENLTLREIPTSREFVFRLAQQGPRRGDLAIANLHPRPGEPDQFFASPQRPLAEDHALIALIPGLESGHWTVLLAGTTTLGTQAAVEYVAREDGVRELATKLGVSRDEAMPAFEAVIRVTVTGGVPVASEVAALHRRQAR